MNTDVEYIVLYGQHDLGSKGGRFRRNGFENALRSAELMKECGYQAVVIENCCQVCGEVATCFPPTQLVSGYEDPEGFVNLCDSCAKNDDIDPNEYREEREF